MIPSDSAVLYDVRAGVATVTLNRPQSLNSMNDALMLGLDDALQRVEADDGVRVVVLTGAGRGFCSGADLSAVGDDQGRPDDPAAAGDAAVAGMDDVFHPPIGRLAQLPVPSIARINGVAAGGGLGLALGCDIAVAARSARFVCTFGPRLGIVPDLGTTFHLPHRVGKARARGIAMLGDPISAEQAAAWGLIWSVVDDDALDGTVARAGARAVASGAAPRPALASDPCRTSRRRSPLNSRFSDRAFVRIWSKPTEEWPRRWPGRAPGGPGPNATPSPPRSGGPWTCLLYTSDAADDLVSV